MKTELFNKEIVRYAKGYAEHLKDKVDLNLPHLSFYEYVSLLKKEE